MWGVEPSEIKSSIFCYKTGQFEVLTHDANDTCEDVCKELCKRWKIAPLVQLLFGLKTHSKNIWLSGCRSLNSKDQYEFRVRFMIPKWSDLNQLDKNAYDYFYHQVRYDVIHNSIPEMAYPRYKHDIAGLCVTDMYVEMIENNKSVEYLQKNFKNYIPKEMANIFAKKVIAKSLKSIKNKEHDVFYVKGAYLEQVDSKAPNYLTEEYEGTTPYPKEDDFKEGTCNVRLQINPFDHDEPGLRIFYAYKKSWKHLSKFTDFYTIQIDTLMRQVSLEIQNSPLGFAITMGSVEEIESFVSCLSIYYRLMVKWNMDLCSDLQSPSLKFLTDNKIHGPIGGAYSYNKIEEKNSSIGSFIVRQCEKVYDTFYIDIVTKENQPETFKILHINDRWRICAKEAETEDMDFENLIDLAKSIQTNGRYFRLPPTQHDRSPLLLLCQSTSKLKAKEVNGLRNCNPLLLRARDDLLLYKWSQRDWNGDGTFKRMKAEYNQSNGKKIDVTLKILKPNEVDARLIDFVKLADKWAKVDLSEIVRMHGITLQRPIAMVLESIKFGALDEFLRTPKYQKDVALIDLVETAYSLAKALHYLQENQIVHGRIRCSSLQVTQFTPDHHFIVKLGDPGLNVTYTNQDVPWIPIEDYSDFAASRNNLKADIWAYATTLWEIFSRGGQLNIPDPVHFFSSGERPSKPNDCATLPGIYELMKCGWDVDPERRFPPQKIFSRLLEAKTSLSRNYELIHLNGNVSNGTIPSQKSRTTTVSDNYNGSVMSADTEHTYITAGTTQAYIEHCGSSMASHRSNGGSSQVSLLNENSSNGSQSTIACFGSDDLDGYLCSPGVLEFDDFKLIFQGEIGSGNYGRVFRGNMESFEGVETTVAIKQFHSMESNTLFKDFQREAKIMKKLKHENIVKIYGFMEEPILIIMEYMHGGSLLTYLSIHQPDLKVENLLIFAANIAKGMHYLEQKRIVHRDLAARNVLVANEQCVKICDFGLAQFIDGTGYYQYTTKTRALPLKWYAYEALKHSKFSHKSDVWSYGVTLFEMFTFGGSPNLTRNPDLNATQIMEKLEDGVRLPCPKFCPKNIYDDLMSICWDINPKMRPTFAELLKRVDDFLIVNGESV